MTQDTYDFPNGENAQKLGYRVGGIKISSMESRIYSETEMREYADLGYTASLETHRGYNGREMVRQLLQRNQELQAKVDEAARIEDMLKRCGISRSVRGYGDEWFMCWDGAYWWGRTDKEIVYESLSAALTSLVGGGK